MLVCKPARAETLVSARAENQISVKLKEIDVELKDSHRSETK